MRTTSEVSRGYCHYPPGAGYRSVGCYSGFLIGAPSCSFLLLIPPEDPRANQDTVSRSPAVRASDEIMEVEADLHGSQPMESSVGVLSVVASCVMVFGGALPYLPQYQEIQRSNDTTGFSTRVCLVLLLANILRIFFWVGKQFELPLLLQSVVMISTMFCMLRLCCHVHNSNRVSTKQHRLSELDPRYFWQWTMFEDYLLFCLLFSVGCCLLTLLLLDSPLFVEALGGLALLLEALLGLPQLLQNLQQRSTRGMSVKMVVMWTLGDVFKTSYFLLNESPVQFWVCGSVQIVMDALILLQVFLYAPDAHSKFG
ncbi:unnamed protein product [Boreogadus saida]